MSDWDGNHTLDCLRRRCQKCGSRVLERVFEDIFPENSKEISWNKWEYIVVEKETVKKRGMSCVSKKTDMKDFVHDLTNYIEPMAMHLFRAEWQHQQMKTCIDTLVKNEVCLVMDYAQDYLCRFQNVTQTAFFEQNQVTIHPIMAYYKKTLDDKEITVKHAILGVTDNDKKDASGVKMFEKKAVHILKENMDAPIDKIIEFTDGCAAQYKGKNAFYDISVQKSQTLQRIFFETSHGKSVCNGLGAVIKRSCY